MLVFPNAKINLGLTVTEKRSDGYHNIETVFYPVNWCDALEILPAGDAPFTLSLSGLKVNGTVEDNLLFRVWKETAKHREIPPLKVHLHKIIPMGAGLGGGSSNAAFFINLLDKQFNLELDMGLKKNIASRIGSDCAFFLENKPVFAVEKGDKFSPVNLNLSKYYILLVFPGINSNTAEAYSAITPGKKAMSPAAIVENTPVSEWKNKLENDFETGIFKKYPEVGELKSLLYRNGAVYASMSGSGSCVYGIFEKNPEISFPENFSWFVQTPAN